MPSRRAICLAARPWTSSRRTSVSRSVSPHHAAKAGRTVPTSPARSCTTTSTSEPPTWVPLATSQRPSATRVRATAGAPLRAAAATSWTHRIMSSGTTPSCHWLAEAGEVVPGVGVHAHHSVAGVEADRASRHGRRWAVVRAADLVAAQHVGELGGQGVSGVDVGLGERPPRVVTEQRQRAPVVARRDQGQPELAAVAVVREDLVQPAAARVVVRRRGPRPVRARGQVGVPVGVVLDGLVVQQHLGR